MDASRPQLTQLVRCIEQRQIELGIDNFGVSISSLEDCYIKMQQPVNFTCDETGLRAPSGLSSDSLVAGSSEEIPLAARAQSTHPEASVSHESATLAPSWKIFLALLVKRYTYAKRDLKGLLFSSLLPLVFLGALMVMPPVDVTLYAPHYMPESGAFDSTSYAQCERNLAHMPCAYHSNYWRQVQTVSFEDAARPGWYVHIEPDKSPNLVMKPLSNDTTEFWHTPPGTAQPSWYRPQDFASFYRSSIKQDRFSLHVLRKNYNAIATFPISNDTQGLRTSRDLLGEPAIFTSDFMLPGRETRKNNSEIHGLDAPGLSWHITVEGIVEMRPGPGARFNVVRGLSMDDTSCPCRSPDGINMAQGNSSFVSGWKDEISRDATIPVCANFSGAAKPNR